MSIAILKSAGWNPRRVAGRKSAAMRNHAPTDEISRRLRVVLFGERLVKFRSEVTGLTTGERETLISALHEFPTVAGR